MRFLFLSAETTKQRLHQYIARSQPNKQKRKAPKTKTEGMHHAKNGRSISIKKRRKSSGAVQFNVFKNYPHVQVSACMQRLDVFDLMYVLVHFERRDESIDSSRNLFIIYFISSCIVSAIPQHK